MPKLEDLFRQRQDVLAGATVTELPGGGEWIVSGLFLCFFSLAGSSPLWVG
jgi:hypothetical protein